MLVRRTGRVRASVTWLVLPILLAASFAACAEDEALGPLGKSAGRTPDGVGADGGAGPGKTYPPLPPYVVDDSPLPSDYSIYEHGKECFERFRVEIPDFDCDGPDASRMKIEVDGSEVTSFAPAECDVPSLVGTRYACMPGARVTKFETVNMYGHTIATVVVCRRSTFSSLDSGRFENIAVIQSDLQNGETCWYQIRQDSSYVARDVPAPYAPGRAKGDAADRKAVQIYDSPVTLTTDDSECYRCHDSQVWLRTPWISVKNQAASPSGKVHEIPRTQGEPTYIGRAYRTWNLRQNRPTQIKIDRNAFDQAFPLTSQEQAALQAGTLAPSDACTGCHTIGHSDLSTGGQGTCNHFARYFMDHRPSSFGGTVLGSKLSAYGDSYPRNAWMPPSAAAQFPNESAYRAYYGRALTALETCCDNPSQPGCTGK